MDPDARATQCSTAGAYILDANICSGYHIGRFWGIDNLDGVAPIASITAPANGASVSGTVNITANASDNVGVERVDFLLDAGVLGSDATAPYPTSWNAAAATNDAHVLQARAQSTRLATPARPRRAAPR